MMMRLHNLMAAGSSPAANIFDILVLGLMYRMFQIAISMNILKNYMKT